MVRFVKFMVVCVVLAAVVGCAAPNPFAIQSLPKGERLDIRDILGAHAGQRACVDYEAATNSCTSIITAKIEGDTLVSREIAALRVAGSSSVRNIEVVSRSSLSEGRACLRPQDVNVAGRDEMSKVLQQVARELIVQAGGTVCNTYYRSGEGYVVSPVGADGQPVPPGDIAFQFITGQAALRAQ